MKVKDQFKSKKIFLKTAKQMERHLKGISNHHRINILLVLSKQSLSVDGISEELGMNFQTASQHSCYLQKAGLLEKNYIGRTVINNLSPYGKFFVKFLKNFQKISV